MLFIRRKMLVFMATQDMVDFHAELLDLCLNSRESDSDNDGNDDDDDNNKKISFLRLHGSMSQAERVAVFKRFRDDVSAETKNFCGTHCIDVFTNFVSILFRDCVPSWER